MAKVNRYYYRLGYRFTEKASTVWSLTLPPWYQCLKCNKEVAAVFDDRNIDADNRCCEHCGMYMIENSGGRRSENFKLLYGVGKDAVDRFQVADVPRDIVIRLAP